LFVTLESGIVQQSRRWNGRRRVVAQPSDFSSLLDCSLGCRVLDLATVLKRNPPGTREAGITGVGWRSFRHTVETLLAELDEHQSTIRDYFASSDSEVTNK